VLDVQEGVCMFSSSLLHQPRSKILPSQHILGSSSAAIQQQTLRGGFSNTWEARSYPKKVLQPPNAFPLPPQGHTAYKHRGFLSDPSRTRRTPQLSSCWIHLGVFSWVENTMEALSSSIS